MSGSNRGHSEPPRDAANESTKEASAEPSREPSRESVETKPDAEGTADQKDVDRDSEGVYYMSVEDFERRRPPRPRPDDGRGRR